MAANRVSAAEASLLLCAVLTGYGVGCLCQQQWGQRACVDAAAVIGTVFGRRCVFVWLLQRCRSLSQNGDVSMFIWHGVLCMRVGRICRIALCY